MIFVASNPFKGTLSAAQATRAMVSGVQRARPGLDVTGLPMSDGGQGFLTTLEQLQTGLYRRKTNVRPPVGRRVTVPYLESEDGTAYAETATVAGLHLIPEDKQQPAYLSSRSVGELLCKLAAQPHIRTIVLGLGDTATLDGGAGLLTGLGVKLLASDGTEVPPGNGGLGQIARFDLTELSHFWQAFRARNGRIICACDVRHPLLGPDGAVHTFGLQKGATPEELPQMEANMRHWAACLEGITGRQAAALPGAGAAGGIGFALAAWAGAELVSGAQWLTQQPLFQATLTQACAILTGEGKLDRQSLNGKTTGALAELGRSRNIPVVAFAGRIELTADEWQNAGFTAVYELPPHPPKHAGRTLSACVTTAVANLHLGKA